MARKDREQISVPIDADLHAAIESAAEAEHRTVAGQIRHWITAALASQGSSGGHQRVAR
ncbi:MAG: TA system antitoxin ParD family protein [Xanthobacteraceae bacterium]